MHDHRPFALSSTCRTCISERARAVAAATYAQRPDSPMSDTRLAEIETSLEVRCGDWSTPSCYHHDAALEVLAEVHRLRRELRLAQASRGVPYADADAGRRHGMVGGD